MKKPPSLQLEGSGCFQAAGGLGRAADDGAEGFEHFLGAAETSPHGVISLIMSAMENKEHRYRGIESRGGQTEKGPEFPRGPSQLQSTAAD
jgi:hypothetical protein